MQKPDAPSTTAAACPYVPDSPSTTTSSATDGSTDQSINPLNYMFSNLPQTRAPGQKVTLPTRRETSSIPKADGSLWEYPSPQQMYNAMRRKGFDDAPEDAVESMVAVHNWLNEGAWAEICVWEDKFSAGVLGYFGLRDRVRDCEPPTDGHGAGWTPRLVRFQGRRRDVSPKAQMYGFLGRIMPDRFGYPSIPTPSQGKPLTRAAVQGPSTATTGTCTASCPVKTPRARCATSSTITRAHQSPPESPSSISTCDPPSTGPD